MGGAIGRPGIVVVLCALLGGAGCTDGFELPDWVLGLGDWSSTAESGSDSGAPAYGSRPDDSSAHTETEVISFKDVLFDDKLSRDERIQAFAELDPGALRTRVVSVNKAPSNVGAAQAEVRPARRRSQAAGGSELRAARGRVAITMYSTSWCGVCKLARDYMNREGISFVEHDVDESASARAEYQRLNPRKSVPTLQIDEEVLVGFGPQSFEAAMDRAAAKRL